MSLRAFEEAVSGPDERIHLALACLMIAQDAYPDLDLQHYLGEIDRMALRLEALRGVNAEAKVVGLNRFLFGELGYSGNADDYYDPRNSYLNEVIDRRTGIPITLSVLYMALGRRIGLPLEGISFPGHFLVRLPFESGVLVLDPFSGGVPLTEEDLRERLRRVIPAGAADETTAEELPLEQFLEPATNRQTLLRLLRNLKAIYLQRDEPHCLLAVLNRMLLLAPDSPAELRDRGFVYQRLECWRPAFRDLTAYLEREPDASDLDEVRSRLIELKALCVRVN